MFENIISNFEFNVITIGLIITSIVSIVGLTGSFIIMTKIKKGGTSDVKRGMFYMFATSIFPICIPQ